MNKNEKNSNFKLFLFLMREVVRYTVRVCVDRTRTRSNIYTSNTQFINIAYDNTHKS